MSNSDVDSNPNTPIKSERRPLLKKSRTISDEFRTSTSNFSSSSLSTSQFSPTHRISTSPLPAANRFSRRIVVLVVHSDRDWYYPSFLGPHSVRSKIKIKTVKSFRNNELPPLSTIRVQNRAATVSIDTTNKENPIPHVSIYCKSMYSCLEPLYLRDYLGSLLKQLAIANKSIGGGVVVVLAERDKEEMEMDIAKLEFDFMGTSVICRSGSPLILADLKKVSVSKARAIIVLASDENADQSDARALRVVLSLSGVKEGLSGHVVVEMSDLDNEPLVKLVGGDVIETVVAHDVIGRLMIQCALQPGLAQIWEDILGFENAEFYIKRWPQLDGLCFEDVAANGGKIVLNPDDDYVLKEGDEILVIAEDDDTYSPGPIPEVRCGFFPKIFTPPKYPEKILFCGWRRDIHDMIMVLEALLAQGSELWMFNEVPIEERERKLIDGGLDISGLANLSLVHTYGNAVIRRHLESLPLETFDSILILADESLEDSIVHSDSRSLATLLLIRDIQSKRLPYKEAKSTSVRHVGFSHSSWIREMQQASDKSIIISEILDSRTRNLVSVSRISDYVLSNEFVSMALAMVAEDKQINRVLEELFAEEGSEMCIRPAEFYLYDQEELCFYDIMRRGQQRQEIVVGYRLSTADRAVINPQQKLIPQKWSLDDVFVVISGGDR
ncbi:hypothetical protein MKX01_018605 [Papaver californicum]|nr:hypothetical protein MKX01_018605 [Papaver californicum]